MLLLLLFSLITMYFNVILLADDINLYKYECVNIITLSMAIILIYTNNNKIGKSKLSKL